jgi:phosphate transport system substrate-binding protein
MTTAPTAVAAAPAEAAKEVAIAKAETKGKGAKAAKEAKGSVATTAEPSQFARVVASVSTSAHVGFSGVHAEAFSVSDNAKAGGKFAKVTADAVTVKGKLAAKPAAAPIDSSEKSNKIATPKLSETKPVAAKPEAKVAAAKPEAKKPAAAAATRTYKVSTGDTLYSIAKKNAVDVNQLRAMNGLKDNNVHAGQVLKVSAR